MEESVDALIVASNEIQALEGKRNCAEGLWEMETLVGKWLGLCFSIGNEGRRAENTDLTQRNGCDRAAVV